MKSFINNYSLETIKNKLVILYMLNITDIIFTLLLLNTGFYIEINPLMVKIIHSTNTSFLLKIILPAILFIFLYFRMQLATNKQLKQSNFILNGIIGIYILINASHLIWFTLLPIFMCLS